MTKTERIQKLEAEVGALKTRIAMLEARPIQPWYGSTEPWPKRQLPAWYAESVPRSLG